MSIVSDVKVDDGVFSQKVPKPDRSIKTVGGLISLHSWEEESGSGMMAELDERGNFIKWTRKPKESNNGTQRG